MVAPYRLVQPIPSTSASTESFSCIANEQWIPGTVHEFYASTSRYEQLPYARSTPALLPIITALTHIPRESGRLTLWIGRSCWPTPFALLQAGEKLHQHIFIDAPTDYDFKKNHAASSARHTALLSLIEAALTSYGTHAVISTIDNLTLTQSRRFVLATKKYNSSLLLLYRQLAKRPSLHRASTDPILAPNLQRLPASAAHSRWIISPIRTETPIPCCQYTLYSTRGRLPRQRSWIVAADNLAEEQREITISEGDTHDVTSTTILSALSA